MTLLDNATAQGFATLRAILASIDGHEAAAQELRARKAEIEEEIAREEDLVEKYSGKALGLDDLAADAGVAERVLKGEFISAGAGARSARLHHNAVVDDLARRSQERAATLRGYLGKCQSELDRELEAKEDRRREFYTKLSSVAYDAAETAVLDLVARVLFPLHAIVMECTAHSANYDARVGAIFHHSTRLFRITRSGARDIVMPIWPPAPGPSIATMPELSCDAALAEIMEELAGSHERKGAHEARNG